MNVFRGANLPLKLKRWQHRKQIQAQAHAWLFCASASLYGVEQPGNSVLLKFSL